MKHSPFKSLDELIESLETCVDSEKSCKGCNYHVGATNCAHKALESDVLYYLRYLKCIKSVMDAATGSTTDKPAEESVSDSKANGKGQTTYCFGIRAEGEEL